MQRNIKKTAHCSDHQLDQFDKFVRQKDRPGRRYSEAKTNHDAWPNGVVRWLHRLRVRHVAPQLKWGAV